MQFNLTTFMKINPFTSDILNRLVPTIRCAEKAENASCPDEPGQLAEKTRHLSKYIFARQYGLNTPFTSTPTKGFMFTDYMDREVEIKVGAIVTDIHGIHEISKAVGHCKTPKRLKDILPMLENLIRRHSRCGYLPLGDLSCPSKVQCPLFYGTTMNQLLYIPVANDWSKRHRQ